MLVSRLPDAYGVDATTEGIGQSPLPPVTHIATLSRAPHAFALENFYRTLILLYSLCFFCHYVESFRTRHTLPLQLTQFIQKNKHDSEESCLSLNMLFFDIIRGSKRKALQKGRE